MPILVKCANPDCPKSLRVKDELAGKTIRCPACKTPVKVFGAAAPAMVTTTAKPIAEAAAPPPTPAKKPAPVPAKTSPKPPPPDDDDVPTLEGFDDFDDSPLAKNNGKVTNKPAPAKKPAEDEPFDDFTDEPPKKGKAKRDDLDAPKKGKKDDPDDDYDEPRKKGKGKKHGDLDDLPDTLWEDCDLFRHKRLATKGKFSLWKNSFRILDPDTDEEVGQAEENLSTWKGWLRMFKYGPIKFDNWLTIDMEIRETPRDPVLFYMRRLANPMPWNLVRKIEILDFRKRRIGYFKTKLFALLGGFWIYDDDDEQVAELKGKFLVTRPRMDFCDIEGEPLGDICLALHDKKYYKRRGWKITWGEEPMIMTMKKEIRDHIPTKILFLAATMATQLAAATSSMEIG